MFLYSDMSTFRSIVHCAVPNMAVVCCFSISCFCGMLLRYFFNDFEMILIVVIIIGITFDFTSHMRGISVVNFFII
jgi:uncharacterized membrane protein YdfJ with MMPL/SSD domain